MLLLVLLIAVISVTEGDPFAIFLLLCLVGVAIFVPRCPMQTETYRLYAVSTDLSCTNGVYDATPGDHGFAIYMYSDLRWDVPNQSNVTVASGRVTVEEGDQPRLLVRRTHAAAALFSPTLVANFRYISPRYIAVVPPSGGVKSDGPER